MEWFSVAVGGALGSAARHGVNVLASRWVGASEPYGTATVNLLGSFVIGVLAGAIAAHRLELSPSMRAFAFVGIIGGFTTFSSLMLESLALWEGRATALLVFNLLGQVVGGLVLVFAGYQIGLRAT